MNDKRLRLNIFGGNHHFLINIDDIRYCGSYDILLTVLSSLLGWADTFATCAPNRNPLFLTSPVLRLPDNLLDSRTSWNKRIIISLFKSQMICTTGFFLYVTFCCTNVFNFCFIFLYKIPFKKPTRAGETGFQFSLGLLICIIYVQYRIYCTCIRISCRPIYWVPVRLRFTANRYFAYTNYEVYKKSNHINGLRVHL